MGCDTFVALPGITADGSTILAKNSNREPNEAHELVALPARDHAAGATVRTTYRTIPQARRTKAVLLAKPYWIWGAEMGVNDHGVAIGNEAIFSRVPHEREPGLIGMDLLRLALERAGSAAQAVAVITSLLSDYGQSGNCRHQGTMQYFNSYLVADPTEAWVLETVGREWAARRVAREASRASISNALTIHRDFDTRSPGLIADAVARGWCRGEADFDLASQYSDRLYTRFSGAGHRQARTGACLAAGGGAFDVADAMAGLRDHGDLASPADPAGRSGRSGYDPACGLLRQEVCLHAGYGPARIDQSTGSMVAHLTQAGPPTVWLTGTSAPCTSVFKPVWLDGGLPDLGPRPSGRYDPATLWWAHEDLHRESLRDFAVRRGRYTQDREALEAEFRRQAESAVLGTAQQRAATSRQCFAQAQSAEADWLTEVRTTPRHSGRWTRLLSSPYGRAWRARDRRAGRT